MFLGIDIGTTASKAIVADDAQRCVVRAEIAYPTAQPRPGLSEQDPRIWIEAVETMLGRMRRDNADAVGAVRAIGLSGQMHSLVALDENGAPVCPAILWNDTRGTEACAALTKSIPDLMQITGVEAMPSFTAVKLLWLRDNRPAVFGRIRTVMLAKDFVRLWLTGERVTDMSDAAATQLFDQAARRWSEPVVAAVGLTSQNMPALVEGTEVSGTLRPAIARKLGLPAGIPVAGGGADAAAGAVGVGCVTSGTGFISLGTGALYAVAQDRYEPHPGTLIHHFAHCVPKLWYRMAAMLNGASCLAWAARLLGEPDIQALLARVEQRHAGPSRVLFLPYLSGERTPHNDPNVRGCFLGLDPSVDAVDVVQAVLDGVAFCLRDAALALAAAGCVCAEPALIGGGARSTFWTRIIATVLGRPIVRYEDADLAPALGAARLAIVAATGAPVAAVATTPKAKTVIEPDGALVGAYLDRHARYAKAYPAVAEVLRL